MSRLLLVSNHALGAEMAGPAIRYLNLARELAKRHDVTLVAPAADVRPDGVEVVTAAEVGRGFRRFAAGYDALLAQQLRPLTMASLARGATRTVYDLYVPYVSENLPLLAADRDRLAHGRPAYLASTAIQRVALAAGDAFVCAGERQRDLWLGALGALGRIGLETYAADRTLRSALDVVPFGLSAEPPQHPHAVVKGVVPGIGKGDRLLLWAGGVWNWFDPLTVIRAVAELARGRDDVKLLFLGLRHPHGVASASMAARAVALAEELGVRDTHVFFNERWVPYEERGGWLVEADLGVSAHFDDVETRFAFRTRLLDHFWAGLPTVSTEGDELGDLVAREGLGLTVPAGSVDAWVAALEAMLEPAAAEAARAQTREAAARFTWARCAERLERVLLGPGAPLLSAPAQPLLATRATVRAGRAVLAEQGPRRIAREAVRRLRSPGVP